MAGCGSRETDDGSGRGAVRGDEMIGADVDAGVTTVSVPFFQQVGFGVPLARDRCVCPR